MVSMRDDGPNPEFSEKQNDVVKISENQAVERTPDKEQPLLAILKKPGSDWTDEETSLVFHWLLFNQDGKPSHRLRVLQWYATKIVRDEEDAKDRVNDGILAAYHYRYTFDPQKKSFLSWVYLIVRRICTQYKLQKLYFEITDQCLEGLKAENVPNDILEKLAELKGQVIRGNQFLTILRKTIGKEQTGKYKSLIQEHALSVAVNFMSLPDADGLALLNVAPKPTSPYRPRPDDPMGV